MGSLNPSTALVFGTVGVTGVVLNCMVFMALPRCDLLSHATLFLMRTQCFVNVLGLLDMATFNTFVAATGTDLGPQLWSLPGAMLVCVLYMQFALQVVVAFNRYFAFRDFSQHESPMFSSAHTKFYILFCSTYGLAHGAILFTPYCRLNLDPTFHTWKYEGPLRHWRHRATILNDVVVYTTLVVCYVRTVRLMRGFRSSLEDHQKAQLSREKRFLLQFAIIAGTWFGYSMFYRVSYFLSDSYPAAFMSEFLRFLMFAIDPIVYLCFMRQLKKAVKQVLCCENTVQPIPLPSATRRSTLKYTVKY